MVLGQMDAESPQVLRLAREILGEDGFSVATVMPDAVDDYYNAADAVVLASTREGFGRVYVEALAHGLPCLAHDYDTARYVLGEEGYFANFTMIGELAALIQKVLAVPSDEFHRRQRHRSAHARFAWQSLHSAYLDLIRRCAALPISEPNIRYSPE
jgi:glycosyltransferase involved in cell wall biosynthesis